MDWQAFISSASSAARCRDERIRNNLVRGLLQSADNDKDFSLAVSACRSLADDSTVYRASDCTEFVRISQSREVAEDFGIMFFEGDNISLLDEYGQDDKQERDFKKWKLHIYEGSRLLDSQTDVPDFVYSSRGVYRIWDKYQAQDKERFFYEVCRNVVFMADSVEALMLIGSAVCIYIALRNEEPQQEEEIQTEAFTRKERRTIDKNALREYLTLAFSGNNSLHIDYMEEYLLKDLSKKASNGKYYGKIFLLMYDSPNVKSDMKPTFTDFYQTLCEITGVPYVETYRKAHLKADKEEREHYWYLIEKIK